MAVAQGTCPSCGAPIEFGVGSSIAKVCEYCKATVVRTDRGLQDLGRVAAIANTPSLIAVGDEGTLSGRPFQVLGRVQLDHGKGPWDEYYVAFDYGQAWGWLAYAQGRWHVTSQTPGLPAPPYAALQLEVDIPLGQSTYRVAEIKSGTIVSAEGELPAPFRPGTIRYYADLYGLNNAFATLDYGDNATGGYEVFTGWMFAEPQMQITQLGARSVQKVRSEMIKCPSCGGDVPKLSGDRAQRVGCPYCGAVSDIGTQKIVAQQEAAMKLPDIPIGSRGAFDGIEYICIAYLRRSTHFDGSRYTWEEYLIWAPEVGYRWLVKDPETGWSWVTEANPAEVDLRGLPDQIAWGGRGYTIRNRSDARVDYVLGEVYWQVQVGETSYVTDFVNGRDVMSREEGHGEVHYSYSAPVQWSLLAAAFGLPLDGPGASFTVAGGLGAAAGLAGDSSFSSFDSDDDDAGLGSNIVTIIVILVVLFVCTTGACGACFGDGGGGGSYRGGGIYIGGK